jgi:DMSO/TMAO reductase YedYZ heme-binding membrane subunit
VTAILGVIHYKWLVKLDIRVPMIYAAILSALLLYRVIVRATQKTPVQQRGEKLTPRIDRNNVAAD